MLQMEEAVKCLCAQVSMVTETETVDILNACGRILARDYAAPSDQPPFPRSPLDGYAVRGNETLRASKESPVVLKVVGKIYAGEVFSATVHPGEAVRLMTGAPIPDGADTVIRQEDTDLGTECVQIYAASSPWQNYCPQGEDYRKGDVLLKQGRRLDGCAIAMLASLGYGTVEVRRRAKVAVFSSGDEVIAPGEELTAGKIYDSNRFYVSGRLTELGNPPVISAHCQDSAEVIAERIRAAAEYADMIITTGGVSVGEKDMMHAVVEELGAERLFWRVALKPGAPTLAMKHKNTLIICLSGNPYGAAANFELLVRPVMEKLTGNLVWQMEKRKAVLVNDFAKGSGVRRFLRGFVEGDQVRVVTGNQASGALSSLLVSNCLVEIPTENSGARKGDQVRVYLL